MDTTELMRRVRRIEIKSRRISDNLFSGEYHSAFKGHGMSFSEVREYVPGDEIRSIDWNVTARTGTPHVKMFEEERELTILLVIDVSRSTHFGSTDMYRRDLIVELAAVLAFSANNNNDKVGLVLFSDEVEVFVPPKKGRKHSLRIIREIIQTKSTSRGTNLGGVLDFVSHVMKKKSIVFLISDMISDNFDKSFRITSRRHDLIGIWCTDPLESRMPPNTGLISFEDAETGKRFLLDTFDSETLRMIENNAMVRENYLVTLFKKNKSDLIKLQPNESYIRELLQFFNKRHRA